MKSMLVATLVGAVSASTASNPLMDIVAKFDEFVNDYRDKKLPKYTEAEELNAFKNFVNNMEIAARLKAADPEAQYSHKTPYADKNTEDMKKMMGFKPTLSKGKFAQKKAPVLSTLNLPKNFDWREKGAVNDPKNQQQCGSCWAFATVANVEGANFVANGELLSLSEQELVGCSDSDNGCEGGLPENAYEDMISKNMGLELEDEYPYDAVDESCQADQSKEKVFLSGWTPVSDDEEQMQAAVMKYGPLAIGINAQWMQLYSGGISNPPVCDPSALDHGVAIVGWGEEDGTPYWTIRNSWGSSWGESGYYRIIRGKGKCGLNKMVTSAEVGTKKNKLAAATEDNIILP